MSETLGTLDFCSFCKESKEENGEMICTCKEGVFYRLPVKNVLCAPCIKPKVMKGGLVE